MSSVGSHHGSLSRGSGTRSLSREGTEGQGRLQYVFKRPTGLQVESRYFSEDFYGRLVDPSGVGRGERVDEGIPVFDTRPDTPRLRPGVGPERSGHEITSHLRTYTGVFSGHRDDRRTPSVVSSPYPPHRRECTKITSVSVG